MVVSLLGRFFSSYVTPIKVFVLYLTGVASVEVGFSYPTPVDYDGSVMKWLFEDEIQSVTFEVVDEGVQNIHHYSNLVEQAARIWSSVETSAVKLRAYTDEDENKKSMISIHLAPKIDGSSFSSGYAIFDEYDGTRPLHCSIYVLVDASFSSRSIAKTILHEMGHCLGLGHSLIPEAIMSYQLHKNSFALDLDDKAALSRLYPLEGKRARLPPGCAILQKRRPALSRGFLGWLVVIPLLWSLVTMRLQSQENP